MSNKMKNFSVLLVIAALFMGACDDGRKNAYMLDPDSGKDVGIDVNPLNQNGYDWWWHSFTGINAVTGEERQFFIEYYVINPGLGGDEVILGQLPENQAAGIKPSYAMIKAGTWGADATEINNFYPVNQVTASIEVMDVDIAGNTATETHLAGSVNLSQEDADAHPEYMSDGGQMSWNLDVNKLISFDPGYATSELPRDAAIMGMAWHVAGMKTEFSGTVDFNGESYNVIPESSYGYADKNYGNDYTNPWIWLNFSKIVDKNSGSEITDAAFVVGGGRPEILNIPLWKTALVVMNIEGEEYEWNFTKLWENNWVKFDVDTTGDDIVWNIGATNNDYKIEVTASNPKDKMLWVNYENPAGVQNHTSLWNGGNATGEIKLYKKKWFFFVPYWKLIGTYEGSHGGCEYGEY